ncbi:hypothetical protein FQN57_003142 [Myotisia sp. PD_48]|nr:hypothetical protein FQN57_003142 [Myotisia sp. PD_48]
MAKAKAKGQKNSHIQSRISHLHRISDFLQSTTTKSLVPSGNDTTGSNSQISYLARQYTLQYRAVSLKSQIRLDQDIKRSICKRCDSPLRPGSTSTEEVENKSQGKKKPWADVLVVTCNFCGTQKRYPQTQKRSMKLAQRRKLESNKKEELQIRVSK